MRYIVSGATGFIGSALLARLHRDGHTVVRLVRRKTGAADEALWNPDSGTIESGALEGADVVVHLAGENIAGGRWTAARKRRILDSRVNGTRLLATTLAGLSHAPRAFLSASAVGYYGDRGDEPLTEQSTPGRGFLADVCQAWEAAAIPARESGIRTVQMRFGVVLDRRGGALPRMVAPFRFGLGGSVGRGNQIMSWISLHDLVAAAAFLAEQDTLSGPVNLTEPEPVRNGEFARIVGRILHRPAVFPVPATVLRLMLGEMADEMLLSGQRALPKRLLDAGFEFQDPQLEPFLRRNL